MLSKKRIEQYIPKINIKPISIILVIFFLILIGIVKRDQEKNIKIGHTILFMKNYDKAIQLSGAEQKKYEAEVTKYHTMIQDAISKDSKLLQEGRFAQEALNQAFLGHYNDTIKTLNKALGYVDKSFLIWSMLGDVYAQIGEYKIAVKYYELILQNYAEGRNDIQKKIVQMYILLKDPETAGKYYIDYLKMGGEKDLLIMNEIRDLEGLSPLTEFKQPDMQDPKKIQR